MTSKKTEATIQRLKEGLQLPESLQGWDPSSFIVVDTLSGGRGEMKILFDEKIEKDFWSLPIQEIELPILDIFDNIYNPLGDPGVISLKILPNGMAFVRTKQFSKITSNTPEFNILPLEELKKYLERSLETRKPKLKSLQEEIGALQKAMDSI